MPRLFYELLKLKVASQDPTVPFRLSISIQRMQTRTLAFFVSEGSSIERVARGMYHSNFSRKL